MSTDFKYYISTIWHVFCFVLCFSSFAVPTILEAQSSNVQEFGWPVVTLGSWSVLVGTLFFFLCLLLDMQVSCFRLFWS